MCIKNTGEDYEAPIFKNPFILLSDWEYDEDPITLSQMVNIPLAIYVH